MESVFLTICMLLQTNSNLPSNACNSAFTASYINSDFKKEVDTIKGMYNKKVNNFVEENKGLVYSGAGVYTAYNSYQTKRFTVSMPLEPFANQFSMDLKPDNQSFNIIWKWNF